MADKDRRSNMADSSVKAQPKKDGAGGNYTWGSATDDPVDFIPASSQVAGPNVSVSTAPVTSTVVVSATPFSGNLVDNRQFPSLSGMGVPIPAARGVVQVPAMAPGARAWPASSAPKVVLSTEVLRPGTTDLFDSSHPRNMFATRPVTSTVVQQSPGPQQAIDWSGSGVPLEINRSLVASGSPNHLGLYQQVQANRVPTQYLRPATQAAQPTRGYRAQPVQQPMRSMVKQNYGQGSRGGR